VGISAPQPAGSTAGPGVAGVSAKRYNKDVTHHDLFRKLDDRPFRPFRIRLSNATAIDIPDPGAIVVGETSAIVPTEIFVDDRGHKVTRDWKTISIAHIVELIDLNEKESGPKRKRA
jgi:hypothetical protein